MIPELFVEKYRSAAMLSGDRFRLNPAILLAQAALESGWGESRLATEYHNFFGITGYGNPTLYWEGEKTPPASEGGPSHLPFRIYSSPEACFMDFARLLSSVYPIAASLSFYPNAYAKEIAYSAYISEVNGDNRADYQKLIVRLEKTIRSLI